MTTISTNNIAEINMINNLIENSSYTNDIKNNLIEVLNHLIKSADKVIHYIDEEDILDNFNKAVENGEMAIDSDLSSSDDEYIP